MNEFTTTPTVENQRAVSVNLCPNCGVPPQLVIYFSGMTNCFCGDFQCNSYDVQDAGSWRDALQQWNQNTAKAYAERTGSPISTPSDSEPADVENRPQDGLECDTREQLEASAEELTADFAIGGAFDVLYGGIIGLLDRQAAITERNCRMEYEDMRDYLQARVDSLTAERNDLRSRLKTQADSFQKLERDNAEMRDLITKARELLGGAE